MTGFLCVFEIQMLTYVANVFLHIYTSRHRVLQLLSSSTKRVWM